MIFKGFSTYLRLSTRNTLKYFASNRTNISFLTSKIHFLESTQQVIVNQQQKKRKRVKKPEKQQSSNDKINGNEVNKSKGDNQPRQDNLARIIRYYRIKMEETKDKINEIAHHAKKIADYYKKRNHNQFVEQKTQLESILSTIVSTNLAKIQLTQYFALLDFLRVCANIESISYPIFQKTQQKIFSMLKNFQKQILQLPLAEISVLYCKVTPIYHPDAFAISSLLHDMIAQSWDSNKTIDLNIMQIYVIIRSMSKKQFLSFPDKKILQMLLKFINDKRIDKDKEMIIQLAVALKDVQVQANISDTNICQISRKIQAKAVKVAQKGLDNAQIQYLLWSKKSQNPYFTQIFLTLARNTLNELSNQETAPSHHKFKRFVNIVKQIPSRYRFQLQQKQMVVRFCERFLQKRQSDNQGKSLQFQLLELIRTSFFGQDIALINPLFESKLLSFVWSFPLQYSIKGVPFPLQIIESNITQNTSKFKLHLNNLKTANALQVQSRLHPQSQILRKCLNSLIQEIKSFQWKINELGILAKFSVFKYSLVQQFHELFQQYYFEKLIPSDEQIKKQRQIKKGERSQLLKFWEYLMIQSNVSYHLISKIPVFALLLASFREKKIKNQEIHPKIVLLQAINYRLSSGKLKFADQDNSHIIQLLIIYSNNLDDQKQYLCQLYWNCLKHLIDQYGYLRKNSFSYVNFLISKLLHIQNPQIRYSIYYKGFVLDLIKAVGLLTITNTYDYFKTAIIRQGLHNNLISDLQLPQVDLAYFTAHQKDLLNAMSGKYVQKTYSSQSLISFFKLVKFPKQAAEYIQKILEAIENSNAQELSKYLIHYSFQKSTLGDKILNKICEKLIEKFDFDAIDLMSLIRNITQLYSSNIQLFEKFLLEICQKIIANLSRIYLADHYQILKVLHENNIFHQSYEVALWDYAKNLNQKSSAYIKIMLQLIRNKQKNQLNSADVEFAERFILISPQDLLKLMIYCQQTLGDIGPKIKKLVSYVNRPLQKSLFLAYAQSKFEVVIPKSKRNAPILHQANYTASKLIKLLQQQGISLKLDEKEGQHIYHLDDKTILVFVKYQYSNQCKIINKMLQHIYPKHQIIQANAEGGLKDIEQILNQLQIILGKEMNAQSFEKIRTLIRHE